jgi:hypothetical protein
VHQLCSGTDYNQLVNVQTNNQASNRVVLVNRILPQFCHLTDDRDRPAPGLAAQYRQGLKRRLG